MACFTSPLPLLFQVTAEVGKLLGDQKVDAILCVAGGWAGGNAKSKCESFLVNYCFCSALCLADTALV